MEKMGGRVIVPDRLPPGRVDRRFDAVALADGPERTVSLWLEISGIG